ncbi:ArsR/SmtB family transcription factor [Pseudohoeflea coraliihabitans]|uniref:Metalloregulator ArsR/SmtB family transcription factor n=1 Tax=Pseudohoeflea coraliihabitans TaxID=2860393 RepID=A0ABS6WKX6_9HYPH|nr:metalloregulator ArsR/SmtB family transcription factor [Pseudohoeflea sp. DP4N28-3]MBW3096598.1 metalloregulator ArsR/SmtB family transcription factor [Pseudohoeflea sp. DP4N28-3]
METARAVEAFSALGQDTRLATFRLLVKAGPEGLPSGEIGERLGIRQNTMSTNLGILRSAGLVRRSREGRTIRYRADFEGIATLLSFLLEDCCGGQPAQCRSLMVEMGFDTGLPQR